MPIEDQRERFISEQEDILISLNLKDDYIMSLIKNDVENDKFEVKTKFYRCTKKHHQNLQSLTSFGGMKI